MSWRTTYLFPTNNKGTCNIQPCTESDNTLRTVQLANVCAASPETHTQRGTWIGEKLLVSSKLVTKCWIYDVEFDLS
jgi:hypothetical protein